MKKFLTLILALSMLSSTAVIADEAAEETTNTPLLISEENTEENTVLISEDATEEFISDKRLVEGTVKSVSETQIEIEDLALNIDENTLIADTDLIPTEVKEGDLITVVASSMTTRSLPPQSYAYYIIVRKNAETPAPIYMTVDNVTDGFIYSEDGSYEVSFENSEVGMYKTKNIVKAEELTKGSEIFIYADLMTMSIPALVNPSKIVVMSIAEPAEDTETEVVSKAEALNEQGILLGTEEGLELEREVSRAEAVALIQRTTATPKMVYSSNFDDVPESHWAYSNISWATQTGIVNGVGDNKFEPDRTVTGQELSMMLLNAQGETAEFDKAFEAALELGFVTEEDGIAETDVLTRDATAKIIYNYLNR